MSDQLNYDAVLIVSFGGPESKEAVMPFLENVLRGRNVPRERMLAVAEHYYHFGGRSPINQQIRDLMAALQAELHTHGPKLPIYWGNRNWHSFLADTLRQMRQDGITRALAFVTSAYSSYSGCRQYLQDIARAQSEVGPGAPQVDKLRAFFNHPLFVSATTERVQLALQSIPPDAQGNVKIVFTAHSIPLAMANTSDYVRQLKEVVHLVANRLDISSHDLVYQSRSGAPGQPWMEPDILDFLREVKSQNLASAVVLAPIGFISDHMEVLYDLDVEAHQLCSELRLPMARAQTVQTHPDFIRMIRELILERIDPATERRAEGSLGARADLCAKDCCPAPPRPGRN